MIHARLSLHSTCLSRQVEVNVLIPQNMWEEGKAPAESREYPTLYLLHGYSDNQTAWQRYTRIEHYANQNNMIVIMPSAERSWYTDTTYGDAFFTYIAEELPALCRNLFSGVSQSRENTYVAGLSMGGYGALKLGLTYPEHYRGVAAFSAAADVYTLAKDEFLAPVGYWESIFGDIEKIPGSKHDILHLATEAKRAGKPLPCVYLWCGTEDSLLPQTRKVGDTLLALGYKVSKSESAGDHSWRYWDEQIAKAIPYLLCK